MYEKRVYIENLPMCGKGVVVIGIDVAVRRVDFGLEPYDKM